MASMPSSTRPPGLSKDDQFEHLVHTVESLRDDLHELQQALHGKPELAWKEYFAHDTCTTFIKKQGFDVTRHAFDLETAWSAVYEVGTGGPVIGFCSEMDALPGIGHACGHNLIAMAGIAAAVATARLLEKQGTAGKVVLLGTPAGESGGGKAYMLDRGAYDDMEVCLMTHPFTRGTGAAIPSLSCNASFSVRYIGASAHAGAMPEKGVNALDAVVAAYTNIALLRQQLPDYYRVYHTIQGSQKWTANLIASESEFVVGLRCPTAAQTYELIDRILNCLKAGGLATGCKYEISREALYLDVQQTDALAEYLKEVCEENWGAEGYQVKHEQTFASSDFGNVSYRLPTLHPMFHLPDAPEKDFPHSDTFASSTSSNSATDAALKSAISIAAVGSRFILDRDWAKTVKKSWEEKMKSIDGRETMSKIEKLVGSYPLSPEEKRAIGGCCQ